MTYFFFSQDLWGLHCKECEEQWDTQKPAFSPTSKTTDGRTEENVLLQAFKEAEVLV